MKLANPNISARKKCLQITARCDCQDAPDGHDLEVTPTKAANRLCSTCFYVARGSFKGTSQREMSINLEKYETVREKFLDSILTKTLRALVGFYSAIKYKYNIVWYYVIEYSIV